LVSFLLRSGVSALVAYPIGLGAYYRLRDSGVRVNLVEEIVETDRAAELLREGKLREAEEPAEKCAERQETKEG